MIIIKPTQLPQQSKFTTIKKVKEKNQPPIAETYFAISQNEEENHL